MTMTSFRYSVKRRTIQLAVICVLPFLAHVNLQSAQAKDTWTRVRSNNFVLIGDASERDIREVAVKLEQFRDAFSRLFGFRINSTAVTRVVVFKNNEAFDPYKPMHEGKRGNVAGYFQSGEDVNYITLTAEDLADNPFRVIFHEYVHLLLHNTVRNLPPWFDEGLAEYYSTFDMADDGRKVLLGKVIPGHLTILREGPWLPLQSLLEADRNSPYYHERDKTGSFYAESWALVHYLILGNDRRRQRELATFLDLLYQGAKPDRVFQQAFHTSPQTLENELKAYIHQNAFSQATIVLPEKVASTTTTIESETITLAEARAFLGDLLLHIDRLDEAATMLEQAIAIDPKLSLAQAALGVVRVKQKRFGAAIVHLKKAAAQDPDNYLVHYYLAFALSRAAMTDGFTVTTYSPETRDTMRAELLRAIELNPKFPESYALLAFVNLTAEERLDESIGMVRHALTLAPGRDDFIFVLAQLYMRKEDFITARQVLQPMLRESADETIRQSALTLLNSMQKIEEQLNRLKAAGLSSDSPRQDDDATPDEASLEPFLRKPQNGEQRVQGFLNRVQCTPGTILFSVEAGGQSLTLHASRLDHVRFVTYTAGIRGEMSCGMRRPPNPVVVTYRPGREDRYRTDGEIVAVEFVPADFQLQNP